MRLGRYLTVVAVLALTVGLAAPDAVAAGVPSWTTQSTPNPAGAKSSALYAVSCSSAKACTAAGTSVSRSGIHVSLAERRNGTRWTIQATPNPTGARDSRLLGVSCSSARACTAAGTSENDSGAGPLAERWNGARWVIQLTPDQPGALVSALDSVSCSSGTACTAAGAYGNSSGSAGTLAEHWNGRMWTIQATVNPSGARDSQLEGISCPTATACTAAGTDLNNAGVRVTLAEHQAVITAR